MVKSTLSSSPIYYMSLFVIPHKASLRLENIQRDNFLWEGGKLQNRPHLVKWSLVCMDEKDASSEKKKKKNFVSFSTNKDM